MSEEDKKISLRKAQDWTSMWRDKESDYNKYHECNAFLIPLQDLKDLVAEVGDQGPDAKVRGYLGVKETTDPSTGEKTYEEKLVLVGTKVCVDPTTGKSYYADLIDGYTPSCANKSEADDDNGGGGIWDFTDPCPPECDPNSPLN